ncbi:MAG TPA: hypothetical protein VFW47_09575 [Phenylobacterium sp.]|nr:hypothetical protein [Phenylobacterium sp.]
MATPIRPGFQTPTPQAPARPDAARNAAQRAFFDAAFGKAPGAAAAPQTAQAAPAAPATTFPSAQRIPTSLPADPPTRILRPGSLLDIKV